MHTLIELLNKLNFVHIKLWNIRVLCSTAFVILTFATIPLKKKNLRKKPFISPNCVSLFV